MGEGGGASGAGNSAPAWGAGVNGATQGTVPLRGEKEGWERGRKQCACLGDGKGYERGREQWAGVGEGRRCGNAAGVRTSAGNDAPAWGQGGGASNAGMMCLPWGRQGYERRRDAWLRGAGRRCERGRKQCACVGTAGGASEAG